MHECGILPAVKEGGEKAIFGVGFATAGNCYIPRLGRESGDTVSGAPSYPRSNRAVADLQQEAVGALDWIKNKN